MERVALNIMEFPDCYGDHAFDEWSEHEIEFLHDFIVFSCLPT